MEFFGIVWGRFHLRICVNQPFHDFTVGKWHPEHWCLQEKGKEVCFGCRAGRVVPRVTDLKGSSADLNTFLHLIRFENWESLEDETKKQPAKMLRSSWALKNSPFFAPDESDRPFRCLSCTAWHFCYLYQASLTVPKHQNSWHFWKHIKNYGRSL